MPVTASWVKASKDGVDPTATDRQINSTLSKDNSDPDSLSGFGWAGFKPALSVQI